MTYDALKITVNDVNGVNIATTIAGRAYPSLAADQDTFEFTQVVLDTTNNIIEGVQSNGYRITFAAGAELLLELTEAASSSGSSA